MKIDEKELIYSMHQEKIINVIKIVI